MSNLSIRTPHAAVIVWNYVDRIGANDKIKKVEDLDATERVVISTISCVAIQTSKSKSEPQGSFQIILAPTKNWVSTLTAGSWCAILMSNEPITEKSINRVDKNSLKMIGKIESVRAQVTVDADGARKTLYFVAGTDWGHIFNSTMYVDPYLGNPDDQRSLNSQFSELMISLLFNDKNTLNHTYVNSNLRSLLSIFGGTLNKGVTKEGDDVNRLLKSVYSFRIPEDMLQYLKLIAPNGKESQSRDIIQSLNLVTGKLIDQNKYQATNEAVGVIDPYTLQNSHTLWQILLENSNPALNEMLAEFNWGNAGLELTLYNRIKPFSYKGFKSGQAGSGLKSYFQLLQQQYIDPNLVISVNAGTNWRDKINFIEIRPDSALFLENDETNLQTLIRQKVQTADRGAFNREGFRAQFISTRQMPSSLLIKNKMDIGAAMRDFDGLKTWVNIMKEWYFDTHRMLNGTIVLTGISDYIAVGSNIKFNADLINPTPNINEQSFKKGSNEYVLAHVESISHSFTVNDSGAREYVTTIQFVRGVIVDSTNVLFGEGLLDKLATQVLPEADKNTQNIIAPNDPSDGD